MIPSDRPETPYIIIAGHGRSGSNRLLDAFDCHKSTFCRNEPNELKSSSFEALPPGFFPTGRPSEKFLGDWPKAVSAAAAEIGVRDRFGANDKDYYRVHSQFLGQVVLSRGRLRQALLGALPDFRGETWKARSWYVSLNRLHEATPVFKLLLCQGWIIDAFESEPQMRVIHNLRAPIPFLRSWRHRYAAAVGPERVFQDNLADIDRILEFFGEPRGRFQTYNEAALIETELWRWRYVNESMYAHLSGTPHYSVATYESFEKDAVGEMRRLCTFAGLAMDEAMQARVSSLKNTLFGINARPYIAANESAPNGDAAMLEDIVAKVTGGSALMPLWSKKTPPYREAHIANNSP